MKTDEDQPVDKTYLTLEEALKVVKEVQDEIPFPKAQPKRFTVHATADPSSFDFLTKKTFVKFSFFRSKR